MGPSFAFSIGGCEELDKSDYWDPVGLQSISVPLVPTGPTRPTKPILVSSPNPSR